MKKAVLHIGTEKTGSTSIQLYLYKNRKRLAKQGWLFPLTCDYLSSRKLVVFAQSRPDASLSRNLGFQPNDLAGHAQWKEQFVAEHGDEVASFQSRHDDDCTVIYSSEHLQSRLHTLEEIGRVKSLVDSLYDRVEVLVYLRRQDRYALSAHSTRLRGGLDADFDFGRIDASVPYYNHLTLLQNWCEVFGEEAVTARIFERRHLQQSDVVADFCEFASVPFGTKGMTVPKAANEALSHTAQSLLRCYNRMADDDSRLQGLDHAQLRKFLLAQLETIGDEHGKLLPSRASAEAFMAHFKEVNEHVSRRWLKGDAFDSSYEEYPLERRAAPVIADAQQQLDALVQQFRQ